MPNSLFFSSNAFASAATPSAFTSPATPPALISQRHLDKLNAPIVVAYGTQETPEFRRQNREFAAAVKAAGKPVELIAGEGFNHFEMQETLGNPYGLAGRGGTGADEINRR